MEQSVFAARLRVPIGRLLVRAGRRIGGLDRDLEFAISEPEIPIERTARARSYLRIIFTHHALDRYAEATGRSTRGEISDDLRNVWAGVKISLEPPAGYRVNTNKHPEAHLFGEVADLLFVMVEHKTIPSCFIVVTVVSEARRAQARRWGRRRRGGQSPRA